MREFLSRHLFSPLQGMTFSAWRCVLRENAVPIAPPYWARGAFQTAVTLANERLAAWEERRFGARAAALAIAPPLFILGHWRHGTTHLHNLLGLDPELAFPTLFQTLYPRTFLTTESLVPRLGACLLLRTRPHDNVRLDFGVPNEDEIALCNDTGLSPYLAWVFPGNAAHYDRFLTLQEATPTERQRWNASLIRFLQKLTLRYERPLVLKSPPHTARIAPLLELFPTARFVHIRRDPHAVFRSTRHMYATTMRYWRLQRPPVAGVGACVDDRIIALYKTMYDAFFAQRGAIPAGQFCELAYEDLVRSPVAQVERVYEQLALPGLEHVRPRLRAYLASIDGYQTNAHSALPDPTRQRVAREWSRCFEEWSYPR